MENTNSPSEEELDLQRRRHDFIWFQKGVFEKGRKEEKIMIARKSLQRGLEIEVIAEITGLSVSEVQLLQDSMQKNETN
ncbi:MAG: hypothetical protein Q3M24_17290 [Candidatus Electrothrix aestuarii]|uniref:Rpn family recombination-promoting nuclease/putative transposase n=1 Tax=Candidatus Electrothrix aestuarii TaxID=3062594 RepID=A0AAU8LR98_9BACT|nr:hypothetical protein [Candidatus Electrothrix aestuarii]